MFIDKTLTATSVQDAVNQIEEIFPTMHIEFFGESDQGYDIGVYDSMEDCKDDANDGDNYRLRHRYLVAIA